MDWSFSWLAVEGADPGTVRDLLAVRTDGEIADGKLEELSGLHLSQDHYLIFAQGFDFADNAPLAELSSLGRLITCCVHEPAMYSSISQWTAGQRDWYFVHDGGLGIQHMHVEGEPPPEFHKVANKLMIVQAEGVGIDITVDQVFEIAPQVAQALVGFHHDHIEALCRQKKFERLTPRT